MKKIPFNISYRSGIESGRYSVETRSGIKVTILSWNCPCFNNRKILTQISGRNIYYDISGKWWNDGSDFYLDLFVVPNEVF